MARTMNRPADPPISTRVEQRLYTPSPISLAAPRKRRASWTFGGITMVGLAALLAAWVFASTSQTLSVMVAARDISPGEVITATDLRVVKMGQAGDLRAVQPSQQDLVIGKAARGPIPAGTVVNTGLFAGRDEVIPAGQVVVGAALDAGAAPTSRIASGDRVQVLGVVKGAGVAAGSTATATVLADGTIWAVEKAGAGQAASKLWVSILVPIAAQTDVAQAAADGRLRLSLVGVGG